MLSIDALNAMGADTGEGLGRCFGNEEFYLKLVRAVPDETSFDALRSALDQGDKKAAFDAAHALKGVLSNLALTPLSEPAVEITENLRAEKDMDYEPLMAKLMEERQKLKELCES